MLAHAEDAFQRPQATAIRVPDGAITIDGRDTDWQRTGDAMARCRIVSDTKEKITLWEAVFGDYTGPQDASLVTTVAHDSQYLYILTDVHDQLLINEATADTPFNGDDFEIFIDASPAGTRYTTNKVPDYRQFIFLPGHMNLDFPQPLIWREKSVPGVQTASRLRPWGYTMEVRIPKALCPNWQANPALDAIGFEVTIADSDTAGIDCHHPSVKSSCYTLSPGQHHSSTEKLAQLTLDQTPVALSDVKAAREKELSVTQLCKLVKNASEQNAEEIAQRVLDAIDSPTIGKIADAALHSRQEVVRKAGAYVLFQRKEVLAPVKVLQKPS